MKWVCCNLKLWVLIVLFSCQKNNKLEVKSPSNIDSESLKIQMNVKHSVPMTTVYQQGRQTKEIPNEYGENDWVITYQDTLSAKFRHFKTNRNDTHFYTFNMFKRDNTFWIDVNIEGPNALKKEIQLKGDGTKLRN